jgi:hypothetical protein
MAGDWFYVKGDLEKELAMQETAVIGGILNVSVG